MSFLKTLTLILASGILAGCSGGGGSGGSGNNPAGPNAFETQEYFSQGGLDLTNASAMYLLGGTGAGVEVAVFDSGGTFNHPDLGPNYSAARYTLYSSLNDGDGHGTLVAGVIAAVKNDIGMHGVAYNARIVSYKVLDDTGVGFFTDTQLATAINTMASTNVLITNNSWGSSPLDTSLAPSAIAAAFPQTLAAYRNYDTLGGVQVWAVGNNSLTQPLMEAGLPFYFPDLTSSWIAVMAVDLNGNEPVYTNRCGVAASWCIAAPGGSDTPSTGGIYSTSNDGGYALASGTSFAAPHVAGAIAALKSVFPNLSFQQIRDRILVTANSSGIYANAAIFGQGLLDLDRASRPVGGLSLALSTSAGGPVASASGATINLSAGALAGFGASRSILVLDTYQRAPFLVPLSTFARTRRSYLTLQDLGLDGSQLGFTENDGELSLALVGPAYSVGAVSGKSYMTGVGRGSNVMNGFAQLVGLPLPHSQFRMQTDATGVTAGYNFGNGTFYAAAATGSGEISDTTAGTGIASWSPGSVVALTYVPDNALHAFGFAVATDLQKPMGWSGSGAFGVTGDSVSLGYSRKIPFGNGFDVTLSGQLAYVTADQNPLVALDDALVAAAGLDLSYRLSARTSLTASMGLEQPLNAGNGYIRAASSIDSSGQISFQNVAINQADMLRLGKASFGIRHQFTDSISFSAGGAIVRDGYGETDAIIGVGGKIRF